MGDGLRNGTGDGLRRSNSGSGGGLRSGAGASYRLRSRVGPRGVGKCKSTDFDCGLIFCGSINYFSRRGKASLLPTCEIMRKCLITKLVSEPQLGF